MSLSVTITATAPVGVDPSTSTRLIAAEATRLAEAYAWNCESFGDFWTPAEDDPQSLWGFTKVQQSSSRCTVRDIGQCVRCTLELSRSFADWTWTVEDDLSMVDGDLGGTLRIRAGVVLESGVPSERRTAALLSLLEDYADSEEAEPVLVRRYDPVTLPTLALPGGVHPSQPVVYGAVARFTVDDDGDLRVAVECTVVNAGDRRSEALEVTVVVLDANGGTLAWLEEAVDGPWQPGESRDVMLTTYPDDFAQPPAELRWGISQWSWRTVRSEVSASWSAPDSDGDLYHQFLVEAHNEGNEALESRLEVTYIDPRTHERFAVEREIGPAVPRGHALVEARALWMPALSEEEPCRRDAARFEARLELREDQSWTDRTAARSRPAPVLTAPTAPRSAAASGPTREPMPSLTAGDPPLPPRSAAPPPERRPTPAPLPPEPVAEVPPRVVSPPPPAPAPDAISQIACGEVEVGLAALGTELDNAGKQRLSALLSHGDPEVVAGACRAMAQVRWTSAATSVRQLLAHPESVVRAAAATALGALASRSMVPHLRRLTQDTDDVVVAAAEAAIARLQG